MKNLLVSNSCRKLGKGEVECSIHSGSTIKAHKSRAFPAALKIKSAVSGRTEPKPHSTTRGNSVDFVRLPIRPEAASKSMEQTK
jgi:hypothetical protein